MRRPCLACGKLTEHGSYCRLHRKQQGGTGQRGSTRRWRKLRAQVIERDDWRCTYIDPKTGERCPKRDELEADHIVPVAAGGKDTMENCRTRCRAHNPRGRKVREVNR